MSDYLREGGAVGGSTAEMASTSEYRIREMEARLDRRLVTIESQRLLGGWLARLTTVGFVVTLAALVIVLWKVVPHHAVQTVDSLSARQIVLRDGEGVERGRLTTDADGRARLSLSDREGRERLRLTVLADGSPGLTINDPDGRPRAVLGYLADGTTNLVFADSEGTSRAVFGIEPDGSAQALFADNAGTIRALVGVGADGVPTVSTLDGKTEGPGKP